MATYDTRTRQIQRQQAIADALRASGNEPIPSSIQTSGRFDAPVSGWQYANQALSKLLGAYQGAQASKQQTALESENQKVLGDLTSAYQAAQVPDDEMAEVVPLEKPTTQADRKKALQAAVLRGQQFGGAAAPIANEIMTREMFPAEYTLGADDMRYRGDQPIAVGLPRTVTPSAEDRVLETFVASTVPDATPAELQAGRANRPRSSFQPGMVPYERPHAPSSSNVGGPADMMDDEAVENAALDVLRDPLAMRQYAVGNSDKARHDRVRINNAAVRKMKAAGLTNNDVAKFRARVQGELKSTKGLTDMLNAVESYEKLAKFNGDRLLQLIEGVDTTGVPAIEGAIRYVKAKGGSVDTAEFESVLKTYQTEVARIIAQPRLVGQLTDTQIQEMQKVVSGSASAPQLRRVINRLNLEMDMRGKGIEDQIAKSGGNLAIPGSSPPTTETPPPAGEDGTEDFSGLWK